MAWLQVSLTHWGRATHICGGKLTTIGSDNGLSPGRRQAIIWINPAILLIGPLRTNFSEILIGIQTFSFRKMHLKVSSAKWRPFCLGLNELKTGSVVTIESCYISHALLINTCVWQGRITIHAQHQHIEAQTKWPTFSRWHFQTHFLEWKMVELRFKFHRIFSYGSNWQ